MTTIASRRRILTFICLSSGAWAFEFGLGVQVASLWLKDQGCSDTVIGLNTGFYYLGIVLTSALVPALMRRWGNSCAVAGMLVSGLTLALFPWGGNLAGWYLLRLVNGVASALSLIPTETLINRYSPPEQRASNFGYYAFSIALGWALGNFVGLQLYADLPRFAFVLGGAVSLAAGLLFHHGVPALPEPTDHALGTDALPLQRTFLSFGTVWCQGFLEGAMVAHLSIYLLRLGQSEPEVSWLTTGILLGVIAFQVPVAWLADRLGRTAVLLGCYGVVIAGLAWLPFCRAGFPLAGWLFLVGACSGAFYPLGLSILGEKLPESALARANAWYLAMNCIGSLAGPICTGLAMDLLGRRALFLTGEAAVLLVLATWLTLKTLTAHRSPHQPALRGQFPLLRSEHEADRHGRLA